MSLIVRVLNKLNLIKYLNFNIKSKVNNSIFKIPILGGIGLSNQVISEPWMITMLENLLKKKNGAYLDIGVNIGQTLMKLKSVNPKIEYIGFEPNATCVHYVNKLIDINKIENVSIYPVGVSNENNFYELSLFSNDDSDSGASMIDNFRDKNTISKKRFIGCYNLNEPNIKLPTISIIKIDVEGAELEVLKGLENTILRDNPIIQIEILPVYDEGNFMRLSRQNEIEKILKDWGYGILRIHYTASNEFVKLQRIDNIGIHADLKMCEYIFVSLDEIDSLL